MAKKLIPVTAAIILALLLLFWMQESTPEEALQLPQRALNPEEQRIVEIARDTLIANGELVASRNLIYDPKPYKGGWIVGVRPHPHVFGSDRIVVIDANGKVIKYLKGK